MHCQRILYHLSHQGSHEYWTGWPIPSPGDFLNQESNQGLLHCRQILYQGFLGGSDSKASTCNAGDPGSIPGLGRSPGEGNGNPLLPRKFHGWRSLVGYSPWGRKESDTTEWLHFSFTFFTNWTTREAHSWLMLRLLFLWNLSHFPSIYGRSQFQSHIEITKCVSLSFEDNDRYHGSISNEREKKRGANFEAWEKSVSWASLNYFQSPWN